MPAQGRERMPLAVRRPRLLEAHTPRQDNAPPPSPGVRPAFTLHRRLRETPRPTPAMHPLPSTLPAPSPPPSAIHPAHTAQSSPSSVAITSLPSSRAHSGLSPSAKLHPSARGPGPQPTSRYPWAHPPLPPHGPPPWQDLLIPDALPSFKQFSGLCLCPSDHFASVPPTMVSQGKVRHCHSSLRVQLHPQLS